MSPCATGESCSPAASSITRDPALAEDIVQSAFLRAYERTAQFDAGRPFEMWPQELSTDCLERSAQPPATPG